MAEPDLWPLLALRCLHLTLTAGRASVSPVSFAGYGLMLGVMGRYESARRFGDLALTMAEHPDCHEFRPWTKFLFYDFIHDWTRPAADAIEPLREAIREALLIGDLENAGFMTAVELYQVVLVRRRTTRDRRARRRARCLPPALRMQFNLAESTRELVQNLMGRAPDPFQLVGDTGYDEHVALPAAIERGDITGISSYHITKLGLLFLYGDFSGAVDHAEEVERYLAGIRGTNNVPIFHMTNAIVRLRTAPRRRRRARAVSRARRGYRTWRRHSPQNYEAPWLLVEAEIARAKGDARRAEELYDLTITAADRAGLVTIGALARGIAATSMPRRTGAGRERVSQRGARGMGDARSRRQGRPTCRDFAGVLRPATSDRTDTDARRCSSSPTRS